MSSLKEPKDTEDSGDARPPAVAAAAAAAASEPEEDDDDDDEVQQQKFADGADKPLVGEGDIRSMLQSSWPTVKAVLLRHMRRDGKDTKPHTHLDENEIKMPAAALLGDTTASANTTKKNHRPILEELIEEVEIDTTPSRNHVIQVLGGPFTFLGQWHTEGTIAMVRKDFTADLPQNLNRLSIKQLRNHCENLDIDVSQMVEKDEIVAALEEKRSQSLPINPHRLQPPLHEVTARGDILVMKIAETKEELDDDDDKKGPDHFEIMSNDDFFLSYTREEYIHFASRTDIVAEEEEEDEEGGEEEHCEEEEEDDNENENIGDADNDEEDEDFVPADELDKTTLLNIILGGVIQKFREDNGRGPNTEELLELRSVVASELEVDIPLAPPVLRQENESDDRLKRPAVAAALDDGTAGRASKRVKFSPNCDGETKKKEGDDKCNDGNSKPKARDAGRCCYQTQKTETAQESLSAPKNGPSTTAAALPAADDGNSKS